MSRQIVIEFPNSNAGYFVNNKTIAAAGSVPLNNNGFLPLQINFSSGGTVITFTNLSGSSPDSGITIRGIDINGNAINETVVWPENGKSNSTVNVYSALTFLSGDDESSGEMLYVGFNADPLLTLDPNDDDTIDNTILAQLGNTIPEFEMPSMNLRKILLASSSTNFSTSVFTVLGKILVQGKNGPLYYYAMECINGVNPSSALALSQNLYKSLSMVNCNKALPGTGAGLNVGYNAGGQTEPIPFDTLRNLSTISLSVKFSTIESGSTAITAANAYVTNEPLWSFDVTSGITLNGNINWETALTSQNIATSTTYYPAANSSQTILNNLSAVYFDVKPVGSSQIDSDVTFTILQSGIK